MKIRIRAGRSEADPEKAVLPALIWASKRDDVAAAYSMTFGWWDFYVGILWGYLVARSASHPTGGPHA
jgi:hypothetical protein